MAPQMHCIPAVHSISELNFHVVSFVITPTNLISTGTYTFELWYYLLLNLVHQKQTTLLNFWVVLLAFESGPSKTNSHLLTVDCAVILTRDRMRVGKVFKIKNVVRMTISIKGRHCQHRNEYWIFWVCSFPIDRKQAFFFSFFFF